MSLADVKVFRINSPNLTIISAMNLPVPYQLIIIEKLVTNRVGAMDKIMKQDQNPTDTPSSMNVAYTSGTLNDGTPIKPR